MKEILIVGIVNNCEKTLSEDLKILENSFSSFKRSYYFVESDSEDATLSLLSKYRLHMSDFEFISLGTLKKSIPARVDRIAFCRNQYMLEIILRTTNGGPKYVVVSDMDGINSKLNRASVDSCFQIEDWAVCAANQRGPYYDIYALRAENWNVLNLNESYNDYLSRYHVHFLAYFFGVVAKMFKRRGNLPIEVMSAFGGIAIYDSSYLRKCLYLSKDFENKTICEHVELHRQIRRLGGRVIINPKFINAHWTPNAIRAVLRVIGMLFLGKHYFKFRDKGF